MRRRTGNKDAAILKAAVKVFAENGYHKAKISAIADEAGVAAGSIYLYYRNKQDLLIKIFDELWRNLTAEASRITTVENLNAIEKIERLIDLFFDTFDNKPALALVFINEKQQLDKINGNALPNYDTLFNNGEMIMIRGIKDELISSEIDIKTLRNFLLGGINHLLELWARKPEEYPLSSLKMNVKQLIKKGILK